MTSEPTQPTTITSPTGTDSGTSCESLGQYLVQARRQRHRSREEVAAATGISLKTMSALEEDRQDHLPAKVFVRGLIKIYAKELGIPAEEALEFLDRQDADGDDDGHRSLDCPDVSNMAISSPMLTSKKILMLILLLLCSLAAYYGYAPLSENLFKTTGQEARPLVEAKPKAESAAHAEAPPPAPPTAGESKTTPAPLATTTPSEKPVPAPTATSSPATVAEPHPAASSEAPPAGGESSTAAPAASATATAAPQVAAGEYQYILKAEFVEKTWVKTSVDGQTAVARTYQPHEQKTWQAKKTITIHLGNAGGALLTLNDTPLTNQGKSGQALKLRIPHDQAP